jgi:hypothetical protein
MKLQQVAVVVSAIVGMLSTTSATAQEPIASGQPASAAGLPMMGLTMVPIARYPDETYAFAYSCYRIGRCSAYDLYRFRDRPNRLTRLAPAAPAVSDGLPSSIDYVWVFVPVTTEENILPEYRAASQVRDEFRAVSRLIDFPD